MKLFAVILFSFGLEDPNNLVATGPEIVILVMVIDQKLTILESRARNRP